MISVALLECFCFGNNLRLLTWLGKISLDIEKTNCVEQHHIMFLLHSSTITRSVSPDILYSGPCILRPHVLPEKYGPKLKVALKIKNVKLQGIVKMQGPLYIQWNLGIWDTQGTVQICPEF